MDLGSRRMGTQVRLALKTLLRTIMGGLDGTNVRRALKILLRTIMCGLCVSQANNVDYVSQANNTRSEKLLRILGVQKDGHACKTSCYAPMGP